jgi:hypothetical protein
VYPLSSYDAAGNFTSKNDYGSNYAYNPNRPHVLASVNKNIGGYTSFGVDDNGNEKECRW